MLLDDPQGGRVTVTDVSRAQLRGRLGGSVVPLCDDDTAATIRKLALTSHEACHYVDGRVGDRP